MGILNVTPDSFSDGGRYLDPGSAVSHGLRLLDEGADWLDVGGESTRPGSGGVSVEEELARVIPVIRALRRRRPDAVLSIDTSKAEVAARAIDEGATVVNDVTALSDPEMGPLCARTEVELVLMHMRGRPGTMQHDTTYGDLVGEVEGFLKGRAEAAMAYGVQRERILVDPGIGFGKAPLHNPILIAAVPRFAALGHRVVVGASRKQFLGTLTGVANPEDRVAASIGAALAAAVRGAHVLRIHDVAATRHALTVFDAVERS